MELGSVPRVWEAVQLKYSLKEAAMIQASQASGAWDWELGCAGCGVYSWGGDPITRARGIDQMGAGRFGGILAAALGPG